MGILLQLKQSAKRPSHPPGKRCHEDKMPIPLPSKAPPPWMIRDIEKDECPQEGELPVLEIPRPPPEIGEVVWPPQEQERDRKKDEGERGVAIIDIMSARKRND